MQRTQSAVSQPGSIRTALVALLLSLNLSSAEPDKTVFDWAGLKVRVARLLEQGLHAEGQKAFEAGIRAARLSGEDGVDLAKALNDLGTLYHDSRNLPQAERAYRESIIRWRRLPGYPELGVVLTHLGRLRLLQRKPVEAETLLLEAERILLAGYGTNGHELAPVLNGLTDVYWETGRYQDAKRSSERALALLKNAEHSPLLGDALFVLGKIEMEHMREAEAESLMRRAILVWQRSLGPKHATYGAGLASLAVLLSKKDPDESLRLFSEALAVIEKGVGPDHSYTGQLLLNYAAQLESAGRKSEAKELRRRGNAIIAQRSREDLSRHTIDVRGLR